LSNVGTGKREEVRVQEEIAEEDQKLKELKKEIDDLTEKKDETTIELKKRINKKEVESQRENYGPRRKVQPGYR